MADSAVCGVSGSSGNRLTAWRVSASSRSWKVRVPKPNFSACSRSASSPTLRPTSPKETLQETSSARVRVILSAPQAPRLSLTRSVLVCGRSRVGAAGDERVGGVLARVERRGGGDQLERRARRQHLLDRPVVQRAGLGVASSRCLVLPDRGEVVAGQPVGVVGRAGDHREDLAGARLDRDDGTAHVVAERPQPVVRRLLRVGVDGQGDAAALGRLVVDQVDDPVVDEQPWSRCRTGSSSGSTRRRRGPSRGRRSPVRWAYSRALRVDALVLVGVVGLVALRDRLAADQDARRARGRTRRRGPACCRGAGSAR